MEAPKVGSDDASTVVRSMVALDPCMSLDTSPRVPVPLHHNAHMKTPHDQEDRGDRTQRRETHKGSHRTQ